MKASFLVMFIAMAMTASAAPRERRQMAAIAAASMQEQRACMAGAHRVKGKIEIKEVLHRSGLSVYSDGTKSFVVVGADDVAPAVLGYSDNGDATLTNPHFMWWLSQMDAVVCKAAACNIPLKTVTPDPTKYKESIEPLLQTQWGQMMPYNNLCPQTSGTNRCLTGCVATSIAQVLYYHHGPKTGYGRRTIYYPQYDTSGTAVFVDFSKEVFDWDNMLPTYGSSTDAAAGIVSGTDQQQYAVAQLMRDLGVAVDMNYGEEASGTNHGSAATGLQNFFGLRNARKIDRKAYTEQAWMDIIYKQLNNNQPVVYGGLDAASGGHSFVLDGYDKDGKVHVNWGWYGEDNGYFYVADLDPHHNGFSYQFNSAQDMIIDIKPEAATEMLSADVTLTDAGTLSSKIDLGKKFDYTSLKISGPVNGDDIRLIREMAGRDANGNLTNGRLRDLDIKEASIVSGGRAYLIENSTEYISADNALTDKMFYGCSLISIALPDGIRTIGDGVLAMCNGLEDIKIRTDETQNFVLRDGVVYNSTEDEVISVLPNVMGNVWFEKGITRLHDYALAGCNHVKSVKLPSSLQYIGKEAFNDCINLAMLKTYSKSVPTLNGTDVFKGLDTHALKVYVPRGSKASYIAATQWKDIDAKCYVEFGTTIKARNATREQGRDNPEFSYQVIGDYVEGKAELTCDATKDSPAGKYAIRCLPGSITEEGVEYVDGWLFVTPSTGIDTMGTDQQDNKKVYTIDGMKVENLTNRGIYVVRHADGSRRKVIMR